MKDRATTMPGMLCAGLVGLVLGASPVQAQERAAEPGADAPPFAELNEALAAARARLDELTSAAEIADRASALREKIARLEEEKEALAGELRDARAARRAAERWAQQSDAEVAEIRQKVEALESENQLLGESADRAMAQASRLRDELRTTKDETARAIGARNAAEGRLVEMQGLLDAAQAKNTALEDDLTGVREELGGVQAALEEERQAHQDTQTAMRELRKDLTAREEEVAAAERRLGSLRAQNASLERDMVALRGAADEATELARKNLLAMENKIRLLNAALAEVGAMRPVEPAAGPDGTGGPAEEDDQAEAEGNPRATEPPRRSQATAGPIQSALATSPRRGSRIDGIPLPPVAKPPPARRELGVVTSAHAAPLEDGLQAIKEHEAERARLSLAELTASLPLERRMQAQGLVADLNAKTIDGGLVVTVPGAELFSLNSDRIEDGAYDTLGKLAELVSIYDDRKVVITGHTDAMGDASYNQRLSERRAELVKSFFIEEFDVDPGRLQSRGAGEQQPIASNASLQGRQANRRVEVTILN